MKKIINLLLFSVLFALAACNNEQVENIFQEEAFSLNVMTDTGAKTRIEAPVVPAGYKLRYILEIYNNNTLYRRLVQKDNAVFNFRLVTKQAYDFLIWVDYVNENADVINDANNADLHYNTATTGKGLKEISMKTTITNNNVTRDAFFYSFSKTAQEIGYGANDFGNITCKRPFGQLNIIATDWDFTKGITAITPAKVNITYSAHSKFNVMDGTVSGIVTTPLTYAANANFAGTLSADGKTLHLTCDYIFAPEATHIIPDTKVTLYTSAGVDITHTDAMLINLPIKRNYQTNVKGALISKSAQLTITVDAEWTKPDLSELIPDPSI